MLERMAFKRPPPTEHGWRRERGRASLAEVYGSIRTPPSGGYWRKLLAFLGPGYLVAVGYMDPGNWATSLAGGSQFGYPLPTIAMVSYVMAIVVQCVSTPPRASPGRALSPARRGSPTPWWTPPRGLAARWARPA